MSTTNLVYPEDIVEAPELAMLAVLDAALQQTIYALFAAHPELIAGGTLETHSASGPDLWAADAAYEHIASLQHALARYRQALAAVRTRRDAEDRPW
jgi:hypothetical protein